MREVEITYCVPCNYLSRATLLGDQIKAVRGVQVTLIKGANGLFEVTLDGELIFSKKATGRFPEPSEVIEKIPV